MWPCWEIPLQMLRSAVTTKVIKLSLIWDFFGFENHSVIGLENVRHLLNQSNAKPSSVCGDLISNVSRLSFPLKPFTKMTNLNLILSPSEKNKFEGSFYFLAHLCFQKKVRTLQIVTGSLKKKKLGQLFEVINN